MNKKFRQILVISLLCLILIGSSGGAEEIKSNKTAMVANLEFVNTDVREIFRYLALAGGYQTLLDPGVQGVMSIAFNTKVPAKDAAIALAASSGLKFRWLGDLATLYIGNSTLSDSAIQNKENRVAPLKYLNPIVAMEALTAVVPKNRINIDSSDAKNNRLTISATELEFQNISEIIQDLDRVLPQLTLGIRLVELPEGYVKELAANSMPARMGAYLVTDNQLQLMESQNQFSNLYRVEIPVSESQAGQFTLEDQIPKAPENSPDGAVNYRVENLAVGINFGLTLYPGRGTKLSLKIRAKTGTIINTNPPKSGAGYAPVLETRELTSILPWEPGQEILFTGVLQRSEFQGLMNIPYKFPVLSDLFLGKNILQPAQNSATQTLMILTPQVKGVVNPTVTSRPAGTGPKPTGSSGSKGSGGSKGNDGSNGNDFTTIQSAAEKKELITLDSSTPIPTPTPTFRSSSTPTSRRSSAWTPQPGARLTPTPRQGSVTPAPTPNGLVISDEVPRIQYVVKKGDTLTRIAAKFGVTVELIAGENNLGSSGSIQTGMTLRITVNTDRVYTIKPKETLWRIAKRYGITVEELKDINGIADIEKVEAGQRIVLPVSVFEIKNPQF